MHFLWSCGCGRLIIIIIINHHDMVSSTQVKIYQRRPQIHSLLGFVWTRARVSHIEVEIMSASIDDTLLVLSLFLLYVITNRACGTGPAVSLQSEVDWSHVRMFPSSDYHRLLSTVLMAFLCWRDIVNQIVCFTHSNRKAPLPIGPSHLLLRPGLAPNKRQAIWRCHNKTYVRPICCEGQ